jgi:SAM-dependent methyltransferase
LDQPAARGFAAVSDAYHRARPSWPPEAIDAAFEHWGLDPAAVLVVDVAAGTGRLTQLLAQRCPDVVAIEPLEAMRSHIRDARALGGSAEQLGLDDASAQAIFVAEAFHWFDRAAALAEFARVLVPGGGLAIMWNTPPADATASWHDVVGELFADLPEIPDRRTPPGLTSAVGAGHRDPSNDDWRSGSEWDAFEPVERREFHHVQTLDRTGLVDLIGSWSFVGALDPDVRADLLTRVAGALVKEGVETVEMRWRTDLYLTRRVGRGGRLSARAAASP